MTTNKIDTRDVAKQIFEQSNVVIERFAGLKDILWETMKGILKHYKETVLLIPNEETFIKTMAELADIAFVTNNPALELLDGFIFLQAFKGLDKYVIDRIWGKDWYIKLRESLQIEVVENLDNEPKTENA